VTNCPSMWMEINIHEPLRYTDSALAPPSNPTDSSIACIVNNCTTSHESFMAYHCIPVCTKKTRSSAIAVIAGHTACSILTLFIVIATSRPLNKKICSLSVHGSNNYCGSASAIRSPHTSTAPAVTPANHGTVTAGCVIVVCHC